MTTRSAWWRPPVYDVALWVALIAVGEVEYLDPGRGRIIVHPAIWAPLWAVVTVPVLWRRRHPWLLVWFASAGGVAESLSGRGTGTLIGFVLLHVAVYSVARYAPGLDAAVAASAVSLATLVVHDYRSPIHDPVISYVFVLIPAVVGRLVRARANRLQALQSEVADQAAKRDEMARAVIAAERARIARELHDVIAHSVSVVTVQAVATLGELDDNRVAAARARVVAIEEIARQALADMRRLVAIGDDDSDRGDRGELGPQPGVETLPTLVAGVAGAGVDVKLHVCGTVRPVPAGVGLTLYRVAQEALTNAVNHAPGATVTLRVEYREATVDLEVVNGVPTAADIGAQGGNGLVGMRERTALYGGTLAVGANGDGGFCVHASLPLEPALA